MPEQVGAADTTLADGFVPVQGVPQEVIDGLLRWQRLFEVALGLKPTEPTQSGPLMSTTREASVETEKLPDLLAFPEAAATASVQPRLEHVLSRSRPAFFVTSATFQASVDAMSLESSRPKQGTRPHLPVPACAVMMHV
jgi:hypothetical protein